MNESARMRMKVAEKLIQSFRFSCSEQRRTSNHTKEMTNLVITRIEEREEAIPTEDTRIEATTTEETTTRSIVPMEEGETSEEEVLQKISAVAGVQDLSATAGEDIDARMFESMLENECLNDRESAYESDLDTSIMTLSNDLEQNLQRMMYCYNIF